MGLTVHHLGHSQSERIVWLCEELGIDYELKKYDRAPLLSPPKYIALHPMGAAPVITDDGGVTLAESAACVDWIIHKHGNGRLAVKPEESAYADYLYWFHFTNGTFTPGVSRLMNLSFAGVDPESNAAQRLLSKLQQCLAMMDARLGSVQWLAGDEFSAADVMAVFSLTTHREFYGFDLSKYANVVDYLQRRVAGRAAYVRAMGKGDADVDWEENMRAEAPLPFKPLRKA